MKPTEYNAGDRRGRAAHDLELDAQRDPFLSEALEGFDAVEGDHSAVVEQLRQRIEARAGIRRNIRRRRSLRRFAAAAAILSAALVLLLIRVRPLPPPGDHPLIAAAPPADTADRPRPRTSDRPATPGAETTAHRTAATVPPRPAALPCKAEDADAHDTGPHTEKPVPTGSETEIAPDPDISAPPVGDAGTPNAPHPAETPVGGNVDRDKVVVIAYGTQQKDAFTGTVPSETGPSTLRKEDRPEGTMPPVGDIDPTGLRPRFEGGDWRTFVPWARERMVYPEKLRRRGIAGSVVAVLTIDDSGRLSAVEVLDSPHRKLTREVVRALRRSPRWEPARRDGRPVQMRLVAVFDFPERE